jgi:hypothetical protein
MGVPEDILDDDLLLLPSGLAIVAPGLAIDVPSGLAIDVPSGLAVDDSDP